MSTANTTSFNLDFTEIAEEAWERAGREMRSGYDLKTARRSLNLMTIEWQNRGINMWTLDSGQVELVAGQAEYQLPADTIDVMEHVVSETIAGATTDTSIVRISMPTYTNIPNKTILGKPTQVWVRRLRDAPTVVLYPTPDRSYTLKYWRMRRIQDAGNGSELPDVNFRFLPALVAGLAYHIAMKVPELAERIPMLKQAYEEQYDLAAGEDREKSSLWLVPARY